MQLSSKTGIPEYPYIPTKLHGALELEAVKSRQSTFNIYVCRPHSRTEYE
jgi:hypothetical protein